MAYAAAVTVTRRGGEIRVTISETEAASTSEATIDLGVHALVPEVAAALEGKTAPQGQPVLP